MERLTERDEFGNADITGVDSADLQFNLGFDEFNKVTNALNKLAEYEDLEEQGKLSKLPCTVGDTVYRIGGNMEVCEVTVESISFGVYGRDNQLDISASGFHYKVKDIGKMLFLSKEEAEAALKEMME